MNLRESPRTQQKLSRQSSKSNRGVKQEAAASPLSSGCCRGLSSVRTVSSTAPTSQQHDQLQQRYEKLEAKVVFNYTPQYLVLFRKYRIRDFSTLHFFLNYLTHSSDMCELNQVAGLEKEVQRQTELRVMYRKRMERTQDYLKYCLQIAQENGILDLIVHSKVELSQSPLSLYTANSTPPIPTPSHHPNLTAIIDQAKINGWYINPSEVSLLVFIHSITFNMSSTYEYTNLIFCN